jgi:hypothetical protein
VIESLKQHENVKRPTNHKNERERAVTVTIIISVCNKS